MRRALVLSLFLLLATPLDAHEASQEVLRYRWHLKGVRGAMAGLFLPNRGEGSLVTSQQAGGERCAKEGLGSHLVLQAAGGSFVVACVAAI